MIICMVWGGNDTINGLTGNDRIYGGAGNDILNGGTGGDYLLGQVGSDTYVYNVGDGYDTISESGSIAGELNDTILFGAGITLSNLTATNDNKNIGAFPSRFCEKRCA